MTTTTKTKGQEFAADVAALLRARNPLLWVVTREEARAEALLVEACASAKYVPRTWDIAQGIANIDGSAQVPDTTDTGAAFRWLTDRTLSNTPEPGVLFMRDLPVWLEGIGGASTLRGLRNLARMLPSVEPKNMQAIIIVSPSGTVPPELADHVTVLELPMPDRVEIGAIFDASIAGIREDVKKAAVEHREAAIDAAVGLTGEEAANCFARSLVQLKTVDPVTVAKEKRRVIARERVLEWFDPLPGGLDAVGGLENLKGWLMGRSDAWSPEARDYGLPSPKGCVIVGMSGCGKSLTPKAIATAWGVPLLRFDLGAMKDKFVGGSEGMIRNAFRVIGAIGRCVVWFDEIEKALQGATSGSADGGVAADQLGALLNWMQERRGEAFIIATANDVSAIPPEFLRKGRFDEVWFVDLPNVEERAAILKTALKAHGRHAVKIDRDAVARKCEEFTGSEVAELVPTALYAAFADGGREIDTTDLVDAAKATVPLANMAKEKIAKLREWAVGRARPATKKIEPTLVRASGRKLDV